jgi:uridylate kinase
MGSWRRILLKLSGEMLAGKSGRGLDDDAIHAIVEEIRDVHASGTQLALVVGAGNLVRGAGPNRHALELSQQHLDTMGMLATAINCTALKDRLQAVGVPAVHMSAFPGIPLTEPFDAQVAARHLEAGRVVLFSGGTGLPFFSTDTAAMVRALQVGADALLKGTQVDGVYDGDPRATGGEKAKLLPDVSYATALEKQLRFMDLAALALGAQHGMTIFVFNAHRKGNLARAVSGELNGSRVGPR